MYCFVHPTFYPLNELQRVDNQVGCNMTSFGLQYRPYYLAKEPILETKRGYIEIQKRSKKKI